MTSSKHRALQWGSAIGTATWDILDVSSGATMLYPGGEQEYTKLDVVSASKRWPLNLRSIIFSTMMPLVLVEEELRGRKHSPNTASSYVFYVMEESAYELETPSIVAVWPNRETLRFSADRPLRELPKRLPFISTPA